MKKILLSLMVATSLMSGMAHANDPGHTTDVNIYKKLWQAGHGEILKDPNHLSQHDAKLLKKKAKNVLKACGGTSWIPYIGQATCSGTFYSFTKDDFAKRVVHDKKLKSIKNGGAAAAGIIVVPGQGLTSFAVGGIDFKDIIDAADIVIDNTIP